ncbi:rhomboid-like protein 20 isoform X1 [Rhodamnia argentea]|uniref:Rhomboid-like protein 20 isoform X1 n=1 Tax=Rhodamnia argentea TaxID=178133 RepID=A0A8B8NTY8_9MYRT|nr:rhomboid-like protein 20 isoform X1 [Rhodamnia argentea]
MMNVGPSGFNNAPASRAFIVASGVFTVFFGIRNRADMLGVSYQDIFQKMQMWKLIPAIFAFSSTPELIFGLYLLYYFRIFERQIGSNKFLVFILFSTIVSMALQVLALAVFNVPSSNLVSSGPYAVIFASFVPFFFDIPVSTRFRVLRISFSDKSFIYLASLQLLFSSWRRSFLPGICGILAGSLYRLNVFRIRKAKFPAPISSFFSRVSGLSMGSSRVTPTRHVVGSIPTFASHQRNFTSVPSTAEPSEESVATLVSMGFDRNSARQALAQARNDINTATNILLEAQSH